MTTLDTCIAQHEALLIAENSALSRMDIEAVAALTAEKNRLVNLLRDFQSSPSRPPDLAGRTRVGGLARASNDNKALLERAMLVQRRLMAIVATAAQPPPTGYGKSGAAAAAAALPRAMIARA